MIMAVGCDIKGARPLIVRDKKKGLEECEGCEASRGGLKAKQVDSKVQGSGWQSLNGRLWLVIQREASENHQGRKLGVRSYTPWPGSGD